MKWYDTGFGGRRASWLSTKDKDKDRDKFKYKVIAQPLLSCQRFHHTFSQLPKQPLLNEHHIHIQTSCVSPSQPSSSASSPPPSRLQPPKCPPPRTSETASADLITGAIVGGVEVPTQDRTIVSLSANNTPYVVPPRT